MGYIENTNDLALPNTLIVGTYTLKAVSAKPTKNGKYYSIMFQVEDNFVKDKEGKEMTNTGVLVSMLIVRPQFFDELSEDNQKKNNQTALVKDIASATVESISENVNTSGIGRPHDI